MEIYIHRVTGIKVLRKYSSNGNQRSIVIETEEGNTVLHLFGNTEGADNLPKHEEYDDYDIYEDSRNIL